MSDNSSFPPPTPQNRPPDPVRPGDTRSTWFKRRLWKLPVWAWGSIAVAALLIAGVAAGGAKNDEQSATEAPSASIETSVEDATTTERPVTTPEVPAASDPSETAVAPVSAEVPDELASADAAGFVTYEALDELWASAAAYVVNNTSQTLYYVEVTFNFLAADGTPVATESDYVEILPPHSRVPSVVGSTTDLSDNPPTSIEVYVFAEEESYMATDYVELEIGGATLVPDQYFASVKGTVTNPSAQAIDFAEITCVLVRDDGTTLAGTFTYADRIAPGQSIAWEAGGSEVEAAIAAGATVAECWSVASIE